MIRRIVFISIVGILIFNAANVFAQNKVNKSTETSQKNDIAESKYSKAIKEYVRVPLKTDVRLLSNNQKRIMPLLIEVAKIMDNIYWMQTFGNKENLLNSVESPEAKELININYGPWNRLHGNIPFIEGINEKPKGANFYPPDMTVEEFDNFNDPTKTSLYTLIRRNKNGELVSIPYHKAYEKQIKKASTLLNVAAEIAEDEGFKKYLRLRAKALLTDDYFESDMAWLDMKTNKIDFVVGPIENYEDQLFGYKAANESFILVKDMAWTKRLAHYATLLPMLQKELPVKPEYKKEKPGSNSDLGAYDVVYYAGDCNAGSKTIAINLPNDSRVQLAKGSRKLQLKNAMQAKFDNILVPIADVLIHPSQRKHVKFNSFFENTMFHEVAHGLGIKNTINGKGEVRKALKEQFSAIEEGKADILGLFLVTKLKEKGELDVDLMDNYVTFMASIFRSIRFGASSAHARANLMRFYYFQEMGAFTRDEDGYYSINFDKMQDAMNSLSELILTLQGNGDYDAVKKLMEEKGVIGKTLQVDLDRLEKLNIPIDIVFDQGVQAMGLK